MKGNGDGNNREKESKEEMKRDKMSEKETEEVKRKSDGAKTEGEVEEAPDKQRNVGKSGKGWLTTAEVQSKIYMRHFERILSREV